MIKLTKRQNLMRIPSDTKAKHYGREITEIDVEQTNKREQCERTLEFFS